MLPHSSVTFFRVLSFVCPAQLWLSGRDNVFLILNRCCLEEASLFSCLLEVMFQPENTFFIVPLKPSCVCMTDFE